MNLSDEKIDALVLAGTHQNPKRLILGKNKGFIRLRGHPALEYVIRALHFAESVNDIIVVGPIDQLELLKKETDYPFIPVPERNSFLNNAWAGFLQSLEKQKIFSRLGDISKKLNFPVSNIRNFFSIEPKYLIMANLAAEFKKQNDEKLHVYRMEKAVDNYIIKNKMVGESFPGDFKAELIKKLKEDRSVFCFDNRHFRFQSDEILNFFVTIYKWTNKPLLFLGCDIPLLTPVAVDDFIRRCRPFDEDFYFGANEERDLMPYYPKDGKRGIKRPYLRFYEFNIRVANINVVKPALIRNAKLIQKSFDVRKLKEWRNIIKLTRILADTRGKFKALYYLGLFTAAYALEKHGLVNVVNSFQKLLPAYKIEALASRILGTSLTIVLSPFGGISVDIDSEEDLNIIGANFEEWFDYQYEIAEQLGYRVDYQKASLE